jgi:hypothetical protein
MDAMATVEGIRRYTIHGEPYVILYFSQGADRQTIHQAQLSADALPDGLRVGDSIIVTWLGAIVAGVRRSSIGGHDEGL